MPEKNKVPDCLAFTSNPFIDGKVACFLLALQAWNSDSIGRIQTV